MSDNKYGWTGWKDKYGKYHDNIYDRNAADEYYDQQKQQLEELKRANRLKEEEHELYRKQLAQEREEQYEAERSETINEFKQEELIKKRNFINKMKKVIEKQNEKYDEVLELRNKLETNQLKYFNESKLLKRNLQNYYSIIKTLNRKFENKKDFDKAISQIKEIILSFDLDFSGEIMGRSELTQKDYKTLVNNKIKELETELNDLENKAYHQKLLLCMTNSKYCTLNQYNKTEKYISNINYKDEYYNFLKDDSALDKQREEQIKLSKQQKYNDRVKCDALRKEQKEIENKFDNITYEEKINELENQYNNDNLIREDRFEKTKFKYFIIYGLILTLIVMITAYTMNLITIVILIAYSIYGYKYTRNEVNKLREEIDFIKDYKKKKLEIRKTEILNEYEKATERLKEIKNELLYNNKPKIKIIDFGDFVIDEKINKSLHNMHDVEFIADEVYRYNVNQFTQKYDNSSYYEYYKDYEDEYNNDKNNN